MDKKSEIKEGFAILKINPKLYSLETIYSAAYVFLDKAYIQLDGDPKKEILVKIKPKKEQDIKNLSDEFFNELLNYADYQKRAEQTKQIREMILQRALFTNDSSLIPDEDNDLEELFDDMDDDDDYLDDPEGIAIPWEEKYGKDKNKTK